METISVDDANTPNKQPEPTRQTMKTTMIAGAFAIALAAPAYAEIEGELSLTYNEQFNYRGANGIISQAARAAGLSSDNTYNVGLDVAYALNDQFSLVVGGNVHTASDSGFDHNRVRGGVRYTTECYTLELGYQSQDVRTPIGNIDSSEIYLNLGIECSVIGAQLNLFVAHDTDVLDGTYAELSLKKGFEINESVGIDVTLGVSYSFDYWDNVLGTGTKWNNIYLTIGAPIKAAENLTVTPFVTFSQGYGALDPAGALNEGDEITFGVSASVSF